MRCSRSTLLFLLLAIPATCFSWSAKVVSVTDGDTITVLHNDQQKEIRLYGMDSPDNGQDCRQKRKDITIIPVINKYINIEKYNFLIYELSFY